VKLQDLPVDIDEPDPDPAGLDEAGLDAIAERYQMEVVGPCRRVTYERGYGTSVEAD
jgi:hypothetical protein